MDPKYTKIVRVLPTAEYVVVEITGPSTSDIKTKVVETWKLPRAVIQAYQGVN